jgi:quinol-cytochrome oxidoreductase complex cytochrome b subunit
MTITPEGSQRSRIRKVSRNFFLHIHAPRVNVHSLRLTTTFGLGAALGFCFLILIVTGLLLMLYYTPSVEHAYSSVKDIVFVVTGGRILRNLHRWAAQAMVVLAFLHMMRVFFTGTYLKGRALNWGIGVAMWLLTLLLCFSGYLLPWDQLAYWAITIGSNIAASARELTDALGVTHLLDPGGWVKKLLIGDEVVGQEALTRFYMLHIIFLPLVLLVLLGLHIWRIRKDGGIGRPQGKEPPHIHAWPTAFWAELGILMIICGVLMAAAFFFDAPLREQANPLLPENPAKSPWYFLGLQELVSYSAFAGGVVIPLLFIGFLVSIPLRDREHQFSGIWFSGATGKKIVIRSLLFSLAVTGGTVLLNVRWGWLGDWIPGVPQLLVIVFNPGTLLAVLYIGWSLFIRKTTGSVHFTAVALFTCALIGFLILTAVGFWFRGPDWEFFWLKSSWPGH